MDISSEIKVLRGIMPKAVITAKFPSEDLLTYECDLRHTKIDDKEHEALFAPIKSHFGDRLIERYSYCTGHFTIYARPLKEAIDPNAPAVRAVQMN